MINVIICDDDMRYVEIEKKLLWETANRKREEIWIDFYPNEEELFAALKQREDTSLCILLLDIEMLEQKNYAIMRNLCEEYPGIISVYIFNKEKSASRALEYKPFWFIHRESLEDELDHVIAMAFEELEQRRKRQIVVISNGVRTLLKVKDILYVEIKQRKVFCYLGQKRALEIRGTLKKFLEKLNDSRMVQINSGCAVNIEWIESYTKDIVMIKGGKKLQISRGRSKEVRLIISRYWGEE